MGDIPTLAAASRGLAAGDLTPVDLVASALNRVETLNPSLRAFITVTRERALEAAERATFEIAAGRRRSSLHGIPYALKDIIDVAGVATTAHSNLLAQNIAASDAGVTERLEAAGMILIGKASLHEFARGAPSDQLPWPNARNPWNLANSCGGSSSGSAVAVAAGMVALAIGTDTGGSVRFPAACTGIVGLKPTYGSISRRGILPLSFSLDHVGPLTRTVEDCALAMDILVGRDLADPGSVDHPTSSFSEPIGKPISGLKIGVAHKYNEESRVDSEQSRAVVDAAGILTALGAEVTEVGLPPRALFDAAAWTIILAEGFSIHHNYLRTRPQDYGRTARERLSMGALVTGGDYVQAQRVRRRLIMEFDSSIRGYDAILCAAATGAAPPLEKVDDGPWRKTHPITAPFNLTGHPALVVPAGFGASGLPLSVQFVGRVWGEGMLMQIAHAYEQAAGWYSHRPLPEA